MLKVRTAVATGTFERDDAVGERGAQRPLHDDSRAFLCALFGRACARRVRAQTHGPRPQVRAGGCRGCRSAR